METTINLQQLVSKLDKLADAIKGTSSITNRATSNNITKPSAIQQITSIGKLGTVSGLAKATGLTSSALSPENINSNDLSEKELESQKMTSDIAKNFEYLPKIHDDMVEVKDIFKDGLESLKKTIEDNSNPGLLSGLGALITGLLSGLGIKSAASAVGNVATKAPGAIKSVAKGIGTVATNPWAVGAAAMLYSPELNQGENAATDQEFYKKLQKNKSKSIPESEWAGEFAEGGTIPEGKVGLVGEDGPEIIEGPADITPTKEWLKKNYKSTDEFWMATTGQGQGGKIYQDLDMAYMGQEYRRKLADPKYKSPGKADEWERIARYLSTPEGRKFQYDKGLGSQAQYRALDEAYRQRDLKNIEVDGDLQGPKVDPNSMSQALYDESRGSVKFGDKGKIKEANALDLLPKDTSVRLGKKSVDAADQLLTSSSETDLAKNNSSKSKASNNIVNAPTTINKQTTQNNITPNFRDNDTTINSYYKSRYSQ